MCYYIFKSLFYNLFLNIKSEIKCKYIFYNFKTKNNNMRLWGLLKRKTEGGDWGKFFIPYCVANTTAIMQASFSFNVKQAHRIVVDNYLLRLRCLLSLLK